MTNYPFRLIKHQVLCHKNPTICNRCGRSWQSIVWTENFVYVIMIFMSLLVTGVSGVYMYIQSMDYVHYFNFWIKTVQDVDMEVSRDAMWSAMSGIIEFFLFIGLVLTAFLMGISPALQNTLGMIMALSMRQYIGTNKICTPERGFMKFSLAIEVYKDIVGREEHVSGIYHDYCRGSKKHLYDHHPCGNKKFWHWQLLGFALFVSIKNKIISYCFNLVKFNSKNLYSSSHISELEVPLLHMPFLLSF